MSEKVKLPKDVAKIIEFMYTHLDLMATETVDEMLSDADITCTNRRNRNTKSGWELIIHTWEEDAE